MARGANSKSLNWGATALWLGVIASALAVVSVSHSCRALYAELAELEKDYNNQQVEWGQLLLEQAARGSFSSVEQKAIEKLNMRIPGPEDIVVVRP